MDMFYDCNGRFLDHGDEVWIQDAEGWHFGVIRMLMTFAIKVERADGIVLMPFSWDKIGEREGANYYMGVDEDGYEVAKKEEILCPTCGCKCSTC